MLWLLILQLMGQLCLPVLDLDSSDYTYLWPDIGSLNHTWWGSFAYMCLTLAPEISPDSPALPTCL